MNSVTETCEAEEALSTRSEIAARKIAFELQSNIKPIWNPSKPEWSHMVNGASLTMPYLEPFLNNTMREGMKLIDKDNEKLLSDVKGFISQEAQHYQHHRKYNEMIKGSGYKNLSQVEDKMTLDYEKMKSKSLQWRLAYTAGFETMTMGITDWLVNQRQFLFGGADPKVASFILWHFVEETEHKNVAIDLYKHLYGNEYFARIRGLFGASFHIAMLSRQGYMRMLKTDGRWNKWRSRLTLWKMVGQFFLNIAPAMLRALLPNYHPSKVKDPEWVNQWVDAYSKLEEGEIPILDTSDPEISPLFNQI